MTVHAITVTPGPQLYTQAPVLSASLPELPAWMEALDSTASATFDSNGLSWTSGISTYRADIGKWVCWNTVVGWQILDEPLSATNGGYQEAADGCRFKFDF